MDLSTTVDLPGIVGMVYDETRDLIYFTTKTGGVHRWSPSQQKFLSPVTVGGTLGDIDITPDGRYLLVAQSDTVRTVQSETWWDERFRDTVHRIDLTDLKVEDLYFIAEGMERGVFDIAIAGSDTALITTDFAGSGWNPLRQFDADAANLLPLFVTNTSNSRASVRQSSHLIASEDNRYILILESNISNAAMQIYDSKLGAILSSGDVYAFGASGFNDGSGDISAARGLAFNLGFAFDFKFSLAKDLRTQGFYSGEFSQSGNYLFAQRSSGEIVVIDTYSWSPVSILPVTETVDIKAGSLEVMGPDGRYLVGRTSTGFKLIDLTEKFQLNLTGDTRANLVNGDVANDTLRGATGDDTLRGGGGDDLLRGDDGRDILDGGNGADTLIGGNGDDLLSGGGGDDQMDGGSGIDAARYAGNRADYKITFDGATTIIEGPAQDGRDTLTGIELLLFADQVVPTNAATRLPTGDWFSERFYLDNNPDIVTAIANGVIPSASFHYMHYGKVEGRSPFALFNEAYYLGKNPDVAKAVSKGIMTAIDHFMNYGWREMRDPSPLFDVSAYLSANQDVKAAGVNPLLHYIGYGMAEGRVTSIADGDYYGI